MDPATLGRITFVVLLVGAYALYQWSRTRPKVRAEAPPRPSSYDTTSLAALAARGRMIKKGD